VVNEIDYSFHSFINDGPNQIDAVQLAGIQSKTLFLSALENDKKEPHYHDYTFTEPLIILHASLNVSTLYVVLRTEEILKLGRHGTVIQIHS